MISLLVAAMPAAALAWGDSGHRMIGSLAVKTLPATLPQFLRGADAASDIGEWAREPDRWRGAGRVHDDMRDPGHFVDVDDDGRILGGPKLSDLPPTKTDYGTELRAHGTTEAKAGFLPYTIIDGYQQVVKDFAAWRAGTYALAHEDDPRKHAWLARDLARRQEQTLMDIGIWGHYVGDASQPMHVSVHYNGWGDYPNPDGFAAEPVHVPWEGPFVRDEVPEDAVRAAMAPSAALLPIEAETARYLASTNAQIRPLFALIKAGGLNPGNAALIRFTAERLADGADELRDLIVMAWRESAKSSIGYPPASIADIEAGKVQDTYALLHGGV